MPDDEATLAQRIKAEIRASLARRGVSQAQMARDLGLSEKHVSRVLTGHAGGSLDVLDRMLRYAQAELDGLPSCEVMAQFRRAMASEGGRDA